MRLNDFTVPGDNIKVNGGLRIETESLSGNTSATDRASKGIKPKTFTVQLLIKFNQSDDLTGLIKIAEAVDSNGKLEVYDVVERSVNVANVRQVQFSDNVSWREMDDHHAWRVSFTLIEHKSVPEKKEQRIAQASASPQQAEGNVIAEAPTQTNEEIAAPELTGFEDFLDRVEKVLS